MSQKNESYEKVDRYQQVTDRIVTALEKGVAPWVKPWNAGQNLPHNGDSGHVYQGINLWLCWGSGFADSRWYTFNQIKDHGCSHVRKGEKGTPIVKWLFRDVTRTEPDSSGNDVLVTRRVPILRVYTEFNYEQVEWDPKHTPKAPVVNGAFDPVEACAKAADLLAKAGLTVHHGGDSASYNPRRDRVNLPLPAAFESPEAYWSTAMHEAGHWTGHESRCNRNLTGRFGSNDYAAEELVAELVSAFLCTDLGIQGKLQHAEYIGNWLTILKGDKYAVFTAARLAREASAFLRKDGKTVEDENTADEEVAQVAAA